MAKEKQVFTGDWYPWYPEKALTSEAIDGLTLAEEGAYRRALDKAWLKGSIPADPKEAAKVIGRHCSVKIAERVLTLFRPMPGNRKRMIHSVLERIRREQEERHAKAVEKATKAANARYRKNKGADATSTAQALLKDAIYIDIDKKKKESLNNLEKKNNLEHTQVRASEIPEEPEGKTLPVEVFLGTVEAGLCKRLHVRSLPSRDLWHRHLRWAFGNHFTSEDVLECFDLLKAQDWRTGTITAKTLVENLPNLAQLRGGGGKSAGIIASGNNGKVDEMKFQKMLEQQQGGR